MSRYAMYGFCIQCLFLSLSLAKEGNAQIKSVEEIYLSVNLKQHNIEKIFEQISSETKFDFIYNNNLLENQKSISLTVENKSLGNVLRLISKKSGLQFKRVDQDIIVSKRQSGQANVVEILDDLDLADVEVSGRVNDENGQGLPGASVVVKGTTTGTTTDLDGNYNISVPEDAVLTVSFVGYKTKEIALNGRSEINVSMEVDAETLSEVIVVGYGVQESKDITGSVKSVKSGDFNKGIMVSPGQLLQGKVSGVNITSSSGAPGSGQRIIIRGQGSLRTGTGPLFVVNGFPIGLAGTGTGESPLNFINPEDIESIDVLKDASATAIYGARGANGVIIITTKQGREGVSRVSVSSSIGVSNMAKRIPVFGADEFRDKVVEIGGILEDRGGNTDWQDELTRTAITHNQNLIMSGGTDKLTYRASLGYLDQEGVVLNTGIKRYSGRLGATQKLMNGRLNIDFNLNSTIETGENAHMGTVVSNMLSFNPTYPAYDSNGEPTRYPDLINPLWQADLFKDFSQKRRMIVNIAPSFEIIDGLVFKINAGYENTSSEVDNQEMPSVDPFVEGRLRQNYFNGTNTLIENYLTYTKNFDDHSLTVLGGYSYQKIDERSRYWEIQQFEPNGIEPRMNPFNGQRLTLADTRPDGWARINELQSYFGRATYNYKSRYMLTGTFRIDGSSKFGANNRYGTFPSFAAGWRITEESFMESSPFTNLKLRVGWGQTGNQEIPAKITKESFESSTDGKVSYPLSETGPYPVGTVYTRLANPDIQWEVSTQTNIGIDFELLDGKLSGTIDYFRKVSNNILVEVPSFDPVSPAPTYWTNVDGMDIINKGLEVALDYEYRNDNGLSFSVGANATFIDNVVENSPFTVLQTGAASGSGQTGATINGMVSGHPLSSFYMNIFTGIGPDGLSTYEDPITPEGDNRFVVGSALPDATYNFYANLTYKQFDLGLNFNGVSGNMIYNHTAMNKFYKGQLATSNNTTAQAIEFPNEAITNAAIVSTRFLEDGSFFRLNNMTLGYNFDTSAIGWMQDLRLSLTGQNLFVMTDYSGFDPEVNQDKSRGGIQSFGIDDNGYPKARTFVIGLNVTF